MKNTSNTSKGMEGKDNRSMGTVDQTASQKSGGRKVKAKSNAAEGLRELFVDSLKDIYWAEKALTKELPRMAKNATTPTLIDAIEEHTTITQHQVERLEKVFELMGEKAMAKKCEAMEGLIKEGHSILEETEPGPVRDAGIIAASQKIEHYEIATYGTLCAFAKTLGEEEVAEILSETLNEEKEADEALTNVAYNNINFEAAGDDAKPLEEDDDFLNDDMEEDEDDMEEDEDMDDEEDEEFSKRI